MGKDKSKEGRYCQVWNLGIDRLNAHVIHLKPPQKDKHVPYSTRWLYSHLHRLEHSFCGAGKVTDDWFYRSRKDLANDMQMNQRQVSRAIKQLKELGLIQTWQMHWRNKDGKQTEKHVTAFRILEP